VRCERDTHHPNQPMPFAAAVQVLSGVFNPLPTFPIHRIYLEEIFDCGSHVGTQSPFEFSLESIERETTHSPLLQAVLQ
jgi:hypothetical protein